MQQNNYGDSVHENFDCAEVKNLIELYFMNDWAIRIEYSVPTAQDSAIWIKWDKTLYALKSGVNPFLKTIYDCCKNNPDCSMRLVCEHFNPEYQCIFYLKRSGGFQLSLVNGVSTYGHGQY